MTYAAEERSRPGELVATNPDGKRYRCLTLDGRRYVCGACVRTELEKFGARGLGPKEIKRPDKIERKLAKTSRRCRSCEAAISWENTPNYTTFEPLSLSAGRRATWDAERAKLVCDRMERNEERERERRKSRNWKPKGAANNDHDS